MITQPSDTDSAGEVSPKLTGPRKPLASPERPERSNGLSLTLLAPIAAHYRAVFRRSWRECASHFTRLTSSILGVDPACVSAMPDPERTYLLFAYSDIRPIVADALPGRRPTRRIPGPSDASVHGGGQHQFIDGARSDRTSALLLLRPCPECAELGAYLAASRPRPTSGRSSSPNKLTRRRC